VRLIQLADIGVGFYKNKSYRFLTTEKAKELDCTFLEAGDVLVARLPEPLGRACIFPGDPKPSVTAVDICILRPGKNGVSHKWLMHTINSPTILRRFEELQKGTTRPRIARSDLASLKLPVPPRDEQERTVAKIESLLAQVNASRSRLTNVQLIVKRFRQAVLAAACSGRLTEEWRAKTPGTESATQSLGRVEAELHKAKRQKPEPLRFQEDDNDGELPEGWARGFLNQMFLVETGATPLRNNKAYYDQGKIPWVKTGEVRNSEIWQTEEFITTLAVEETNAKIFPIGTIVIAMYGEGKTRGQVARLRIEAATNQACAALVNTALPTDTADYVYYYCLSQYDRFRQRAFGGNQPNLSLGVIKGWGIPIPPLAEQHEIVRRVEGLFKLAEAIEKRVEAATKRADNLTQAILAKAFRGELVPTEAELARREGRGFEPASVLLERIRAQRANDNSAGLRRGHTKRAKALRGLNK
jgi:type I restriction enzyme S subunit